MAEEMNYLQELVLEKNNLDHSFVHAQRLLSQGEYRVLCLLAEGLTFGNLQPKLCLFGKCDMYVPYLKSNSRLTTCI